MSVLHTPYDGSSKPFTIGLTQIDAAEWLEEDENLGSYISEKLNLYKILPRKVLVEDEATRPAQSEVLNLVQAQVCAQYPSMYQCSENVMHIAGGHKVHLDDPSLSPIARAGLLVQEDLVLMRKSAAGWVLAAASLCFPSAWNLLEKFKRPLHEIHRSVPGFTAGSRNDGLITRMFDNLGPSRILLRWNWSLHGDAVLYHPHSHSEQASRFGAGDLRGNVFIRLERQTLRKLPQSGDIVFTIRIHLNALEMLELRPDRATLAASLEQQLAGLSADEANYKGITAERARLIARLRQIAGAA